MGAGNWLAGDWLCVWVGDWRTLKLAEGMEEGMGELGGRVVRFQLPAGSPAVALAFLLIGWLGVCHGDAALPCPALPCPALPCPAHGRALLVA